MSTPIVEKDTRPEGDIKCFYCSQPVGKPHKDDCVIWTREVVVRMTVEYAIEVPHFWDKEMIEFHRNDSSWCANNALDELAELENGNHCLCPVAKFEYVREKSEESE